MSSSPTKQMIEVIKAIGQQLHVSITLICKLLHVHHCLLSSHIKERSPLPIQSCSFFTDLAYRISCLSSESSTFSCHLALFPLG